MFTIRSSTIPWTYEESQTQTDRNLIQIETSSVTGHMVQGQTVFISIQFFLFSFFLKCFYSLWADFI